jgi:tetratricopeptide (TPR) repeat protein
VKPAFLFYLLLSLFTGQALVNAASVDASAFEAGNKLYFENKFSEAAATYEKLVQGGEKSAALYFNLGNAYFKSGQIGRAVAAYRQAQELSPRDPDIRANLQFARNQTQGPTLTASRWQRGLGRLTLNEWTWLTTVPLWLLLILLAVVQWRPAFGRSVRGWLATLAAAAVILSVCLGAAWSEHRSVRRAIVISPEATIRQGPLEAAANVFVVHDGAELQVLDQRDDWLWVSTDPKRMGWVKKDQVVLSPAS